jgi:SSS family solute:Na+ symporter
MLFRSIHAGNDDLDRRGCDKGPPEVEVQLRGNIVMTSILLLSTLTWEVVLSEPGLDTGPKNKPMTEILNAQRKEFLNYLSSAMRDQPEWIGIHAAEALFHHGKQAEVHKFFMTKANEKAPKYRVGVWRVLARSEPATESQAKWFRRIREALKDQDGPDRLHATETLAKLGDKERSAVLVDASKAQDSMGAYARWALLRSGGDRDERKLAQLLSADDAGARASTAYSLRNQVKVLPETLKLLKQAASNEANDSLAKVYLLSAVFTHSTGKDKSKAKEKLIDFARDGSRGQKYELCTALGISGEIGDAKLLRRFFDQDDPDVKVAAADALLRLK